MPYGYAQTATSAATYLAFILNLHSSNINELDIRDEHKRGLNRFSQGNRCLVHSETAKTAYFQIPSASSHSMLITFTTSAADEVR
jgi:hypothetical protein